MFEYTVQKEDKSRRLTEVQSAQIAADISAKFRNFDDVRQRQKYIHAVLKPEIYLHDRADSQKAKWKSQIFLNKIFSFFQTHIAFIWDNIYSNIEQMFDVEGRDEASEQQAKAQKAALVNSFDRMKIAKQLDPAVEYLDTVGEACLFVSWKKKTKLIRRPMGLLEQIEKNGLLSLFSGTSGRSYGVFEQVVYEGAYVEAINPLNLAFDPAVNPDNDEDWDRGAKIIKEWKTYDAIAGNKLYKLSKTALEELKNAVAKGDDKQAKSDEDLLDEHIDGSRVEVLHYYGDFAMNDGSVLHNWVATVVAGRYLAQFEENPFVINPVINVATQRDPETKRGIPVLWSIYYLCKDQENKLNLGNDVQMLNANPMRYAPKGFFDREVIEAEPGKVIDYRQGMDNPNAIVNIAVPLINNENMISYLDNTTSLVSGIFPNMQGQQEDKKATATEINVKVAGQTTRLAKDVDLLKQNLIVAMVSKVAELEANMKFGEERIFVNDKGQRVMLPVNDEVRQGNYDYRYTDNSGIQKKMAMYQNINEIIKAVWNDPAVPLDKIEFLKTVLGIFGVENPEKFFIQQQAAQLSPQAAGANPLPAQIQPAAAQRAVMAPGAESGAA